MSSHRTTLRLGRLAGVPIGIQPLWLVIVGLLTYTLGRNYFPGQDPRLSTGAAYTLGLLSALTLFAGILLHELGHAVVARRRGVQVEEIDLWLLGGVARWRSRRADARSRGLAMACRRLHQGRVWTCAAHLRDCSPVGACGEYRQSVTL